MDITDHDGCEQLFVLNKPLQLTKTWRSPLVVRAVVRRPMVGGFVVGRLVVAKHRLLEGSNTLLEVSQPWINVVRRLVVVSMTRLTAEELLEKGGALMMSGRVVVRRAVVQRRLMMRRLVVRGAVVGRLTKELGEEGRALVSDSRLVVRWLVVWVGRLMVRAVVVGWLGAEELGEEGRALVVRAGVRVRRLMVRAVVRRLMVGRGAKELGEEGRTLMVSNGRTMVGRFVVTRRLMVGRAMVVGRLRAKELLEEGWALVVRGTMVRRFMVGRAVVGRAMVGRLRAKELLEEGWALVVRDGGGRVRRLMVRAVVVRRLGRTKELLEEGRALVVSRSLVVGRLAGTEQFLEEGRALRRVVTVRRLMVGRLGRSKELLEEGWALRRVVSRTEARVVRGRKRVMRRLVVRLAVVAGRLRRGEQLVEERALRRVVRRLVLAVVRRVVGWVVGGLVVSRLLALGSLLPFGNKAVNLFSLCDHGAFGARAVGRRMADAKRHEVLEDRLAAVVRMWSVVADGDGGVESSVAGVERATVVRRTQRVLRGEGGGGEGLVRILSRLVLAAFGSDFPLRYQTIDLFGFSNHGRTVEAFAISEFSLERHRGWRCTRSGTLGVVNGCPHNTFHQTTTHKSHLIRYKVQRKEMKGETHQRRKQRHRELPARQAAASSQ
jgi:hypothetical protein